MSPNYMSLATGTAGALLPAPALPTHGSHVVMDGGSHDDGGIKKHPRVSEQEEREWDPPQATRLSGLWQSDLNS